MKIRDFLPVGSIVLLKDREKRLMINGNMLNDAGGTGKNFDYMGVLYPEGHIGEGYQFLFNHEDIAEIYFRGFEDSERADFIDKLASVYEKM